MTYKQLHQQLTKEFQEASLIFLELHGRFLTPKGFLNPGTPAEYQMYTLAKDRWEKATNKLNDLIELLKAGNIDRESEYLPDNKTFQDVESKYKQ